MLVAVALVFGFLINKQAEVQSTKLQDNSIQEAPVPQEEIQLQATSDSKSELDWCINLGGRSIETTRCIVNEKDCYEEISGNKEDPVVVPIEGC